MFDGLQTYQRGRGGVTRCPNEVSHQIFMSFLPSVVGCLLKTWFTKGGGVHEHPRTPLATPLYLLSAIYIAFRKMEYGQKMSPMHLTLKARLLQ